MFSNGLAVDDELADQYHNLGDLHAYQDKLVEAEQMYQRALQGLRLVSAFDDSFMFFGSVSPTHLGVQIQDHARYAHTMPE
jgi:hypothetical protein